MDKLFHAIAHCHANGIVHRDIKPENIMIGKDGEVKLIDFGISAIQKTTITHLSTIAGTPYYMSPEMLSGNYNEKCDIWALGVVMYVVLSGHLPFYGKHRVDIYKKITQGSFNFNHKPFS